VAAIPAAAVGGTIITAGLISLERSITPNPRPRPGGTLREHGPYGVVRHPIYAGVILSALAWSLWRGPAAVGPTALTVVVVDLKSRREEAWLLERYPGYRTYRDRVRWRFFPGVW
jgi:protein-S-isoprenylcysteine O-methyltransferase Ste14